MCGTSIKYFERTLKVLCFTIWLITQSTIFQGFWSIENVPIGQCDYSVHQTIPASVLLNHTQNVGLYSYAFCSTGTL